MRKVFAICLAILLVGFVSGVRAQQANANLEGAVKDGQGNALPGVEIVAKDTRTGITRSVVAGALGRYRISALSPSIYDVTFKLAGFKTKTVTGLELFVNETKVLNTDMQEAAIQEEVTVTAEVPLIEATKAEVSTVVTTREVDSLPLLTRQFANLALLAPGTTDMESYDPTKNAMSHFSVGGFRGRAVYYSIDGADSKDNMVGGPVQIFTTEGVSEFSVATNQFKAEYGKSQGTIITVLTKSGTNELHGSVFGFLRDDSLRSLSYFDKQLVEEGGFEKPNYSRYNYGASIGGPIVKDKTHFFLAVERVQEKNYTRVDMLGEDVWNDAKGLFPQPFNQDLLTINLTHQVNSRHSLKLRYGFQYDKTENLGVGGEYALSNGYSSKNTNHNLMLSHTWIVKPNVLNEARAVYQYFDNRSDPNSTEPTHYFSIGGFGQARNMPQETRQTKLQFRDDLSWHVEDFGGTHDIKVGADYYYMPRLDLLYIYGESWYYRHVSGTYSMDSPIRQVEHYAGNAWRFSDNKYHSIGLFVQDDWKIGDRLTLNLGVRYDYNTGLEFDQSGLASVQFLADYIPGFATPGLKHDTNNIAPRLGFAYDVFGNGKTVVRGGYGIFYDQLYAETFMYAATWLAADPWSMKFYNRLNSGIKDPADPALDWVPNDYANPTNLPENQVTPGLCTDAIGPEFQYPYTHHFNLGFSQQITPDFAVDVNYVHTETRGLGKGDEFNRYHSITESYTLSNDYAQTIWAPRFVGKGHFDGLYVSARKRFSQKFELRVNYSFSGGTSSVNYRGTDGWGVTCYVENEPNAPREFGPIDTDERHRLFASGIFELPFDIQFAAMYRFNTPRPYNIYDSSDPNDDGYPDLPADVPHRMYGRGKENFSQLDFRLSKFIRFSSRYEFEIIAELFNAFNASNFRGYQGDVDTPETFGHPTFTTMPLEAQFGLRFRY